MGRVGHAWSVYRRYLGAHLRSQMQYRASFLTELVGAAVVTSFEFGSLALVLPRFDGIGGWTLGEVAFLYGLVEIAFGLMDLLFAGFDPQRFGQEVRRGTLDQLMLRPAPLALQVFASDLGLRRFGRIAVGVAILGFALGATEIAWTLPKLLYLPGVVLGMVLFFGGLFVAGSTVTFWTVESIEVVNMLTYGGTQLISYPMHIYPVALRRFFTWVLPATFLNYAPALWILGKPDPLGLPPVLRYVAPLAGLAVFAAGYGFWRVGVRHYQSTGT